MVIDDSKEEEKKQKKDELNEHSKNVCLFGSAALLSITVLSGIAVFWAVFPNHHQIDGNSNTQANRIIPLGLYNTGNSCYQNAVLQMLHLTDDFTELFLSESKLTHSLSNVFHDLEQTTKKKARFTQKTKQLEPLLKYIKTQSTDFSNNRQQDAHEFLSELFEMDDKKLDLFKVQFSRKIQIPNPDGNGGTQPETLSVVRPEMPARMVQVTLPVPMKEENKESIEEENHGESEKDNDTKEQVKSEDNDDTDEDDDEPMEEFDLRDLVRNIEKEEQIAEYSYDDWRPHLKADATISSVFHQTSKYLILQLSRANGDGKLKNYVRLPEELEITNNKDDSVKRYRLYGAVIHSGKSMNSGHYTALGRKASDAIGNRHSWWVFDDEQVTQSSLLALQNSGKQDTQTPYLLFYVQVS